MRYCINRIIQWEGETDDRDLTCNTDFLSFPGIQPAAVPQVLEEESEGIHPRKVRRRTKGERVERQGNMKGTATSQNAVKLLKLAGFPEEILEKCEETDETLEKSMISC